MHILLLADEVADTITVVPAMSRSDAVEAILMLAEGGWEWLHEDDGLPPPDSKRRLIEEVYSTKGRHWFLLAQDVREWSRATANDFVIENRPNVNDYEHLYEFAGNLLPKDA